MPLPTQREEEMQETEKEQETQGTHAPADLQSQPLIPVLMPEGDNW